MAQRIQFVLIPKNTKKAWNTRKGNTILVKIHFCQIAVCRVLHTPRFSSVKIAAAVGGLTKKASKINAYTPPHY